MWYSYIFLLSTIEWNLSREYLAVGRKRSLECEISKWHKKLKSDKNGQMLSCMGHVLRRLSYIKWCTMNTFWLFCLTVCIHHFNSFNDTHLCHWYNTVINECINTDELPDIWENSEWYADELKKWHFPSVVCTHIKCDWWRKWIKKNSSLWNNMPVTWWGERGMWLLGTKQTLNRKIKCFWNKEDDRRNKTQTYWSQSKTGTWYVTLLLHGTYFFTPVSIVCMF